MTNRAKMIARMERRLKEQDRPKPQGEPHFADWWLSLTPEEQAEFLDRFNAEGERLDRLIVESEAVLAAAELAARPDAV